MDKNTTSKRVRDSVIIFCVFIVVPQCAFAGVSVDDILTHVDDLWRGQSSHTSMVMTVSTVNYKREITLEGWSKGNDKALVVIKSPKKDRGIATLKSGKNVWNYLPKISRVTKVPSSMMSGSWMGSHFTNDDLVKESTFREDYTNTLTFDGHRGDKDVYEMTLIPHEDAPVVWGRVVVTVQKADYLPLEVQYFDEDDKLKRIMAFHDSKIVNGKLIPHKLTLTPMDAPGESTVVHYQQIDFDVSIDGRFFSIQNLKKKRL